MLKLWCEGQFHLSQEDVLTKVEFLNGSFHLRWVTLVFKKSTWTHPLYFPSRETQHFFSLSRTSILYFALPRAVAPRLLGAKPHLKKRSRGSGLVDPDGVFQSSWALVLGPSSSVTCLYHATETCPANWELLTWGWLLLSTSVWGLGRCQYCCSGT